MGFAMSPNSLAFMMLLLARKTPFMGRSPCCRLKWVCGVRIKDRSKISAVKG